MPGPVADAYPLIETPKVSAPLPSESFSSASRNYTFFATDIALGSLGYKEEEFYLEGRAKAYGTPSSTPVITNAGTTEPVQNAEVIASDIPYKTRFVVRRPVDAAKFNGTVVVEWLNVTDGFDGEYFWVQAKDYLLRAGYAYVGVSAQNNAISNPTLGLKQFSPERYGSLDVTNGAAVAQDALSFDIYSQAVKAARTLPGVMGGLEVKRVIAAGMSQSGSRMGTYANYVHLRAPIVDAMLIQVSNPVVRDDLPTPMIKVLSESEANAANLVRTQPDTPTRRTWWIAGSAHGDAIQRIGRTAVRLRDLGPAKTGNDNCLNGTVATRTRTPLSHVVSAAVHHLNRQIETGAQPPSAPALTLAGTAPESVARDVYGNALGGIRLAAMEVPVARADGIQCGNIGAWVPFSDEQIAALYPTHADYVSKVNTAVQSSIAAGFVLPEDAARTVADAQAALYGRNLKCGALCLSAGHFRADYSTTGLLRDNLAYYSVVRGEDLMQAVDDAHRWVAASETETGAAAAYDRNFAIASLERFTALAQKAVDEERLTTTAAQVLTSQANTIVQALRQVP
ncbi:alpha/beta hydrolase domain-containing protein [Comamonas endophytica]|uniref:alpha/beta hydrolase domain-containing protein n=1 Tax=Comamonas endophytica TaxID=2949090 RepID=UPI00366F42D4